MNFDKTKILRDAVDHAGGVTTDRPAFRQPDRTEELRKLLESKILVIDGAMGTMIQSYKLDEADYRGDRFADHAFPQKGNTQLFSLQRSPQQGSVRPRVWPAFRTWISPLAVMPPNRAVHSPT